MLCVSASINLFCLKLTQMEYSLGTKSANNYIKQHYVEQLTYLYNILVSD